MRLWANIYSPDNTYLGDVFRLKSAQVNKALDAAGSISLSASVTDYQALTLLTNENKVVIWVEQDNQVRQFGKGVIKDNNTDDSDGARGMSFSGPDSLEELMHYSTLRGRSYSNEPVADIIDDLMTLAPGWEASVQDGVGNQSVRLDWISVLKSFIRIANEKGLHLREGELLNTLEIGAFGEDSGVRAIGVTSPNSELHDEDDLIVISSIKRKVSSREVWNRVYVFGAGEGIAALTMEKSDRTLAGGYPFEIKSTTGPDGDTLYYIEDEYSIALYGLHEKAISFKQITPISNSNLAKVYAANDLYDAAAAELQRIAYPLTSYSVTGKKCKRTLRVGDTIRLAYKGLIQTENRTYTYIDENADFWIMKLGETISESDMSVTLELSTIDRLPTTLGTMVGQAMEAITVRNTGINPSMIVFTTGGWDTVQWGSNTYFQKAAKFRMSVNKLITDVKTCLLQFTTRPLSATTTFDHQTGVAPHNTYLGSYAFEVRESTNYPQGISIYIDGVDRTTALGGPWAPSNAAVDVTLDISDYIVDLEDIYQTHTIEFRTTPVVGQDFVHTVISPSSSVDISHGFIECLVHVLGTTQQFKSS